MSKVIYISILLGLYASPAFTQKVFEVTDPHEADLRVYITPYAHQADLLVYRVTSSSEAKRPGLWYYTKYAQQADKKIFIVQYEHQADLKIHFVKYKSQAGWKK